MATTRTIDLSPNGSITIGIAESSGGLEGLTIHLHDKEGEAAWHYLPLDKARELRDVLNRILGE